MINAIYHFQEVKISPTSRIDTQCPIGRDKVHVVMVRDWLDLLQERLSGHRGRETADHDLEQ